MELTLHGVSSSNWNELRVSTGLDCGVWHVVDVVHVRIGWRDRQRCRGDGLDEVLGKTFLVREVVAADRWPVSNRGSRVGKGLIFDLKANIWKKIKVKITVFYIYIFQILKHWFFRVLIAIQTEPSNINLPGVNLNLYRYDLSYAISTSCGLGFHL